MTPRDGDPLEAEDVWRRLEATPGFDEGVAEGRAQLAAGQGVKFSTFREQRRRSRFGCSIALLAIVAALVVFWAGIILVLATFVSAVTAAPSAAPQSRLGNVPTSFERAQGQRGAPMTLVVPLSTMPAEPAGNGVGVRSGGAPLPPAYTGKLGYALPSYGPRYLAIRWPRGTVATLCGPADCVTRTSTDFGPVRSLWEKGRLADLSAVDWQRVCGVDLRYGLCDGTLLIVSRPRALPETSTKGKP